MAKPTTVTTITFRGIIENNAPPLKRIQEQTIDSHGTPLTRTKVKKKKRLREEGKR